MLNIPYVSLPEYFTYLLAGQIQNSIQLNNHLELYILENKELQYFVKTLFVDIDPNGGIGRIISIAGWTGIRNRLAALFIEHSLGGKFVESINLNLINDILNLENKLKFFTPNGYHRIFLLGFYAKMSLIKTQDQTDIISTNPLIITDTHIELMKYSKAKSIRLDWLLLLIVHFEHFLGIERFEHLLKAETNYSALYSMLEDDQKEQIINNCLSYGASINDQDIFIKNLERI